MPMKKISLQRQSFLGEVGVVIKALFHCLSALQLALLKGVRETTRYRPNRPAADIQGNGRG